MQPLGKLVGKSRSGRWIVRGDIAPPLGATVVDKDLHVLGRVADVFGPVDGPFVSLRERAGSYEARPGENVYVLSPKDRGMNKWRTSTR